VNADFHLSFWAAGMAGKFFYAVELVITSPVWMIALLGAAGQQMFSEKNSGWPERS